MAGPWIDLRAGGGRSNPQHGAGRGSRRRARRSLPQGVPVAATRDVRSRGPLRHLEIPEIARIGLAICYDGNFPETFRQLAWMGAEVVLQPTLTTTSDRQAELVMARANAIFNQLYVVSLNAAAPAGLGRSVIVDPEGLVRLRAGTSEELLTDVLDLAAVERVRRFGTAGVSRMWDQILREGPGSICRCTAGGCSRHDVRPHRMPASAFVPRTAVSPENVGAMTPPPRGAVEAGAEGVESLAAPVSTQTTGVHIYLCIHLAPANCGRLG